MWQLAMLTSDGSSTQGFVFLPAPVATLEALLRRWLGLATAVVVPKERVSLETGVVSREDMMLCLGRRDLVYRWLPDGLADGLRIKVCCYCGVTKMIRYDRAAQKKVFSDLEMEGDGSYETADSMGEGRYK